MSSTATLTSLAMLKVQIDRGGDYLDYLRGFVMQALVDHAPDPVTDGVVQQLLRSDYGLDIPPRTVQIVINRLSKKFPIQRQAGVYRIAGKLPDQHLGFKRADALRHISAVTAALVDFSQSTQKPLDTESAEAALLAFLGQFDVTCIKAYLRGTAIPSPSVSSDKLIPLVGSFALQLQSSNPSLFDSLMIVVTGHMLANALLCPDLHAAPKNFEQLTIFFDTPVLLRLLGLEGEAKSDAVIQVIRLCRNLGAKIACFSHTRDELERVIRSASDYIDRHSGRGEVIRHAREAGLTKSDFLLLAGQIDNKLTTAGVSIEMTPDYSRSFQIDESAFEGALEDVVAYNNPRAKEDDINSVRSVYALRKGLMPRSIERSKAVLVTSNAGFAKAAFKYGVRHEASREVSSVITDFSLANIAWLKAPVGAPSLPATETIAMAYAALEPSRKFLDKLFKEIEKLEAGGKISATDHQLLRSESIAHRELMQLTLGDDDALTEDTISKTLARVKDELGLEHKKELTAAITAQLQTQKRLDDELAARRQIAERVYWRCVKQARIASWIISIGIAVLLVAGFIAGFWKAEQFPVVRFILAACAICVVIAGLIDNLFGFSVREFRPYLQSRIQNWLLRRVSATLGIEVATRNA